MMETDFYWTLVKENFNKFEVFINIKNVLKNKI